MKAVNSCEENVLSLAGNFSTTCDGHLVAVEKEDRYKTQTLSIVLKANRKGRYTSNPNSAPFIVCEIKRKKHAPWARNVF